MIKNNKGFTMVELLAAVAILGILATIAIVSVTKTMEKSHKEYDEKQNKLFTTAAQTYFTDNRSKLPKNLLATEEVTLQELIKENYIEKIVDYKKKPYNQQKSKAYVKKTGAGKYIYYSVLVGSDDRKIGSNDRKNTGSVEITIGFPNLTETDMSESLFEQGKNIYYVNKKVTIPISLSSTTGISSYQYKINKLKDITSDGNNYKKSGEIPIDDEKFEDTITIDAKDFANGIYQLEIDAYGYDANSSTKKAEYIIVIDKTKPKCTIEVSGTQGKEVDGLTDVYWYKSGDLTAKMKIKDTNKYQYALGYEEQGQNIPYETDSSVENKELPITTNIVDKHLYGYVKDKAGNVGECQTAKPIYYDNTRPTCEINISGGDYHDTGWYWDDISLSLSKYDDNGKNEQEKGENESGVYQYDISTNNFDADQITTYTNSSNGTQTDETEGIIWYGYLQDKAGNQGKCESGEIKLDNTDPYCEYEGESTNWTNSNRTITAKCKDNMSGCNMSQSNEWTTDTKTASFPNFSITDGAGRTSSCNKTVDVYIDKTAPSCSVEKICYSSGSNGWCNSSDGGNVEAKCKDNTNTTGLNSGCSGKGYLYTDGATNTNDNGEKNGEWADAYYFSRDVKAQGRSGVHWYVYDKAGNSKDCGRYEVKVDYTPPTLNITKQANSDIITASCTDSGGSDLKKLLENVGFGVVNRESTCIRTTLSSLGYNNGCDVSDNTACIRYHDCNDTPNKATRFKCQDNAGNVTRGYRAVTCECNDNNIVNKCKFDKDENGNSLPVVTIP